MTAAASCSRVIIKSIGPTSADVILTSQVKEWHIISLSVSLSLSLSLSVLSLCLCLSLYLCVCQSLSLSPCFSFSLSSCIVNIIYALLCSLCILFFRYHFQSISISIPFLLSIYVFDLLFYCSPCLNINRFLDNFSF